MRISLGGTTSTAELEGIRKMRRQSLIILTGVLAWLAAVVVCWGVNDDRLTSVLMPLWRPMLALAGQGPNLGTPENPAYEATPVHAMFGLGGIGFSALVYIGLAWAWQAWRLRRISRIATTRPI